MTTPKEVPGLKARYLIGFIAGLVLLPAVDYAIGRKKHLGQRKEHHFPDRNCWMDIFPAGPVLFEDYFMELKKAKRHIHVLFYIVTDDDFSKEFFSILAEQASKGVEVRLLVDWIGAKVSKESINKLKKAGVQFSYSRTPSLPHLFYTAQVRNHRKITIIDGKTGYTGGFNIGKEYINQDKKLSPWRDYHLKIKGEGVADLQHQFLLDWLEAAKVDLLGSKLYFPPLAKGPVRIRFFPSDGNKLENLMIRLIRKADKSIFIGTPYFIPSRDIFEELLEAIKRGVDVKVLVPAVQDHVLVKEASYPYLRRLIRCGAEVHQFNNGFYHAKVLLIDDTICDLGTANFDKRSLFLNLELNCLIYDADFISRVQQIVQHDLKDSSLLKLEELTRFNPVRSIKEAVARTISYFL